MFLMDACLYFAYGSNMDPLQMEDRCPGAVESGVAVLEGWRFVINGRGVATVKNDRGCMVWGVLWRLSEEDESALDVYESVAEGNYRKERLVVSQHEKWVGALVYVDPITEAGRPRVGYLDGVLAGAGHFGLPERYRAELAGWREENDGEVHISDPRD